MFVFFFFRQKSAYELRISDLSSDVCSSDLIAIVSFRQRGQTEWTVEMLVNLQTGETWRFDKIDDRASDAGRRLTRLARWPGYAALAILANALSIWPAGGWLEQIAHLFLDMRSAERRVGEEWGSTCRSRGARYHSKKKK